MELPTGRASEKLRVSLYRRTRPEKEKKTRKIANGAFSQHVGRTRNPFNAVIQDVICRTGRGTDEQESYYS